MRTGILFVFCNILFSSTIFSQELSLASSGLLSVENAEQSLNNLPVTFRKNSGQWDEHILYRAGSPSWQAGVCFMKNELSFCFSRRREEDAGHDFKDITAPDNRSYLVWNLHFKSSNPGTEIVPYGLAESHTNYLLGNDLAKHAVNVPDYRMLEYKNIYDKIDIRYYTDKQQLKYDFVVKPDGNISNIQMECMGIKKLSINDAGKLEIHTEWGVLLEEIPESYQLIKGIKENIVVRYRLYNDSTFGFSIEGRYDKGEELVIDPVNLSWATYIGATAVAAITDGYLHDIAIDAAGNVYAAGMHQDFFPTVPGSYQTVFSGGGKRDAFALKLNPTGTALIYSTYLGGTAPDAAYGIAVNNAGEAFIVGGTYSSTYPVTAGAFDVTFDGGGAFVTRLNAAGSALLYSTFLTGTGSGSSASGVTVNSLGEAFVTGSAAANFPVTPGAWDQTFNGGTSDAFITKINAAGSALLYSSYVGGSGTDYGNSIILTAGGEAVIAGCTDSNDLPVTPGVFDASFNGGQFDVFIARLNASGSAPDYITYLGGSQYEGPAKVVLNAAGEVYVTGETLSGDYPVTPGAYDVTFGGGFDAFVTKLNATATNMVFSTYLGDAGSDQGIGIALNASDEVFVSGYTISANFPVTACAYNNSLGGAADIFVCKLNSSGSALHYSTFVGGTADDYKNPRILLLPSACGEEEPIVSGTSHSLNFPVTAGAFQVANFTAGDDAPVIFRFKKPGVLPGFTHSSNPTCNSVVNFTDTTDQCGLWGPLTSWSWDFGDGTTSTAQNPAHTYTLAGTYNVKLIVGCPVDSIIIPVTITNITTASAGTDTSVCDGIPVQLNGIAGGGGTSYSWSPASGLNNTAIANPVANPIVTTTYVLTVTNGGVCPVTDTIVVTIDQAPVALISGTTTICSGNNTTLSASGAATYSWNTGSTGSTVVISPLTNSTYTVIGANGTCYDTATFSINVDPSPAASISGAAIICNGDSVVLTASGGTNYNWNTGSANQVITLFPVSNSIYSVTVSNGNCIDTISWIVTVNAIPVAYAGEDDTICEGESITLSASGGAAYTWSNGILAAANTVSPVINTLYTVTVSNGPCIDVDNVNITVSSLPVAGISGITTIVNGESTVLTATGGGSYNWFPSSGLSCADCRFPLAAPVQTTTYCVAVASEYGCTDTACITLFVNDVFCDELFVPNAFSPNTDGQNDELKIFSRCIRNINFTIYDRWGNIVFETSDINQPWDGTYKEKPMDTSVFAYTLNATFTSGEEVIKKGNISLVR